MNTNAIEWDAAHEVIGFIRLEGLYSITAERLAEICSKYCAENLRAVKSKIATHYRIVFGDMQTANYIKAL